MCRSVTRRSALPSALQCHNTASGEHATICGGAANISTGDHAAVSAGESSTASGESSTISGGGESNAIGRLSSASGRLEDSATDECGVLPWASRCCFFADQLVAEPARGVRRGALRDAAAAGA
jgi:hypothetical protein